MHVAGIHLLAVSIVLLTGCATASLNKHVLSQGSALTQVQEEMVLDNLELFRQRPHALPWHIKITSGSITVNDTISPTYTQNWGPVSEALSLAPSRSVQLQWNVVPATSQSDLQNLTTTYKADALAAQDPNPMNLQPRCQHKDGTVRYFNETFEEGVTPPPGRSHGYFNRVFVWVKDDSDSKDCFDEIVEQVLGSAPVTDQDRGIVVPIAAGQSIRK
jgi:hypothetical protein